MKTLLRIIAVSILAVGLCGLVAQAFLHNPVVGYGAITAIGFLFASGLWNTQ